MTTPPNPSELFSPFLPTTYNIPEEDDRLKTFLNENFANMSDVINDKKIGVIADQVENFSGGKWFYKSTKKTRNEYQTILYIPTLPNTGILTFSITNTPPDFPIQKIDPEFVITHIWGSASKPNSSIGSSDGDYFSFMNQGDSRISWTMSDTTIIITTTTDLSAYSCFLAFEYLRNGT